MSTTNSAFPPHPSPVAPKNQQAVPESAGKENLESAPQSLPARPNEMPQDAPPTIMTMKKPLPAAITPERATPAPQQEAGAAVPQVQAQPATSAQPPAPMPSGATEKKEENRGPGRHVLEESRENCSRNATKHGLLAQRLIPGESAEEFAQFHEQLRQQYSVEEGSLESLVLERILIGHWRLRRLWRVEAELMEHLMAEEGKPLEGTGEPDTRLGIGVQRELNQAVSFESLQRYEANIERQLRRAIGELLLMKRIIPSLESGQAQITAYQKLLG